MMNADSGINPADYRNITVGLG